MFLSSGLGRITLETLLHPRRWRFLAGHRNTIDLRTSAHAGGCWSTTFILRLHPRGPPPLVASRACIRTGTTGICTLLTLLQCHAGGLHVSLSWAAHAGRAWKLQMGRSWGCAHGELGKIGRPGAWRNVALMLSIYNHSLTRSVGNRRRDVSLQSIDWR